MQGEGLARAEHDAYPLSQVGSLSVGLDIQQVIKPDRAKFSQQIAAITSLSKPEK